MAARHRATNTDVRRPAAKTDKRMDTSTLNVLDLVAAAILLISAILAFFRGFVHEVLAIAAWVGAALAALYGLPYLQPQARQLIPVTWAADAAAAVAIFLVVLIVLALVTRALSKRVQQSALNAVDRSLGFLFGLARGAFVVAVGFIVLSWMFPQADDRPQWVASARSLPLMEAGAGLVRSVVPQELLSEEDRIRRTAAETEEKARQAMELKETYDKLTQPPPGQQQQQPGAPAQGQPAQNKADQPTYGQRDLQDMQRLIDQNTR